MITEIRRNQFIRTNGDECFSLVTGFNWISFNPDPVYDDLIYTRLKNKSGYVPEEIEFMLCCFSLEEYYEVLQYFVMRGYRDQLIPYNEKLLTDPSVYKGSHIKKEIWNINRIKKEDTRFTKMVFLGEPAQSSLIFYVTVNRKRLGDFRHQLKNLPGYKVNWMLDPGDWKSVANSKKIFM